MNGTRRRVSLGQPRIEGGRSRVRPCRYDRDLPRNRLERHFRDVHTLRHHGFVSESRYETVGQVFLGVPPEFGLVAF
jgi:hypothetical protein